jgi:hypothetical protein
MAGFGPAHPAIKLLEDNAVAEKTARGSHTATSEATLSGGGFHAARFMVRTGGLGLWFGVIRVGWNVERGKDAHKVRGHCFYSMGQGKHYPGDSVWQGMRTTREEGDHIDLLLDLGAGRMAVFKNGNLLGVMQVSIQSKRATWRRFSLQPSTNPGGQSRKPVEALLWTPPG